ncbi:hypothetical protein 2 [Hubei sobemo-like virus 47]|uniref:hypothetical protein 2 n=1 Tax=Hubei sobemo-like virus 47 TaxID=1923235 RepID=UPI0009094621|nr:hypothetical protein 2 [Hubei sobemo-like virus 47]APG75841.1 hypothetical protein 2 [Hubei sobemo-like virus 47]
MEEAYRPVVWRLPDDFMSYERFLIAVSRLDMSSSPGYPYVKEHSTNRQVMEYDGFKCSDYALARMWTALNAYLDGQTELYLSCFIKSEPHKMAKVEEGRWRLIMASPLHVQICWNMLFMYQNDLEISKCYEIPSQQGIVLPGGGWKVYLKQWKSRGYDTGLDKSAWDWTAPNWLIDLDLDFRRRMGRGSRMDDWWKIARKLYDDMFVSPLILLSSGALYKQIVPGVMKSGCVNTISTNSHMQVMVHILACWEQGVDYEPLPVCCGDDTLQRKAQAVDVGAYEKFGAIVKSASEDMEFVGHDITDAGPVPLYLGKHVVKAMHVPEAYLDDYLDSMCRMYCKSPVYEFWDDLAFDCGVAVYSQEYYRRWYDYEE